MSMTLYGQVMKGYLLYLRKWSVVGMLGVGVLMCSMGIAAEQTVGRTLWTMSFGSFFVIVALMTHMQAVLGGPTVRLIPGYLRAHCQMVAIFYTVLILGLAAVLQWKFGAGGLEVAAFLGLLVVGWLWALLTNSTLLMFVVVAMWFTVGILPIREKVAPFWMLGEYQLEAAGLLVVAVAGMAAGLWRLANLTEEDEAYERFFLRRMPKRRMPWQWRFVRKFPLEGLRGDAYPLSVWAAERRFAYHFSGFGTALRVTGILLAACVIGGYVVRRYDWPIGALAFFAVFPFMLPMIFDGHAMVRMRQRTDAESLYPMDRGTFLRGLGWASLLAFLRWWLVMAGGLTALFLVCPPRPGLGEYAWVFLLILLAVHIFMWGSLCWALRWTLKPEVALLVPMGMLYAICLILISVLVMSGLLTPQRGLDPYGAVCCALLVMLAGVWLAYDAYRRWQRWDAGS